MNNLLRTASGFLKRQRDKKDTKARRKSYSSPRSPLARTLRDAYPWTSTPRQWLRNEQYFTELMRTLCVDQKYLLMDVPPQFMFNYEKAKGLAKRYLDWYCMGLFFFSLLKLPFRDKNLVRSRFYFVPKIYSEQEFWKRFFFVVRLVRRAKNIRTIKQELDVSYEQSAFVEQQKELKEGLKREIKAIGKKLKTLEILLGKFFVEFPQDVDEGVEDKEKEDEGWIVVDKVEEETPNTVEKDEEEIKKPVEETTAKFLTKNEKLIVKKTMMEDISTQFLGVVNQKKTLAFFLSEIMEQDDVMMMEVQEAYGYFNKMVRLHAEFVERTAPKDDKREKIVKLVPRFSPKLTRYKFDPPSHTSEIQRMHLVCYIPLRFQILDWRLLYSSKEHGMSLNTLIEKSRKKGSSVLFVQTAQNEIFGFFHAESWKHSTGYYGSGECFLFRLFEGKDIDKKYIEIFPWSKANRLFILSNADLLTIGGGMTGGAAMYFDRDMRCGSTQISETFLGSENLLDRQEFDIQSVEVWGFVQAKNPDRKKRHRWNKKKKLTQEERVEKIDRRLSEASQRFDFISKSNI